MLKQHERIIPLPAAQVGALIDRLASDQDGLWPKSMWPAMKFDRPLQPGAQGGLGPVRYRIEQYRPGKYLRFRFTGPPCMKGGQHWFEVTDEGRQCILGHTLILDTWGPAWISWPLFWRPMHDACVEDALAVGQISLGQLPTLQPWSCWVRFLRCLVSRGKARRHYFPLSAMPYRHP